MSFNSGSIKNVHYGDILVKFDSILCFDNIHIPFIIDDNKITSKMFLKNGDIIFADAAEDHSVGKCVELTNVLGDIVSGLHTIVYRSQIDFAQYFLGYYLNSNSYRKQIFPMVQGAKVSSVNKNNLSITNISFPTLPEQRAIGSFFQELNQLITLQQRELDLIKEGKKTLLSKMFPKDGENFPEIRFPGFTNAWEQRKFKDLSSKGGKRNSSGNEYPVYSVSNQSGLIPQSEQFEGSRLDTLDKNSYKIVEPNDFVYNPARINVGSIAFNHLRESIIVSSLYVIFSLNRSVDNRFALQFIKSDDFIKEVRKNTEGSVREYLFYENFSNIRLPLPPTLSEQTAIGSFFQELDQLITLQQRELEILKIMKSALLKAMFA